SFIVAGGCYHWLDFASNTELPHLSRALSHCYVVTHKINPSNPRLIQKFDVYSIKFVRGYAASGGTTTGAFPATPANALASLIKSDKKLPMLRRSVGFAT